MDQLRVALNWLKRHHFWVLSVLIALIAFGCWWSAAGTMSKDFQTNKQTIESEFNSLKSLRSEPFHANEEINKKQGLEIKQQGEDVAKLWQQLYDRQREGVLVWPSKLGKEFCDYVEKLQFGAEIPQHLRERYQNYVELYFPEMPAKINARELPPDATGGMGGPGRGEFAGGRAEMVIGEGAADDGDYVCDWVDQGLVRKDLDFPQEPTPLRIWVTQENLWVYNTLLNVIAETNKAANASRKSNAAVRAVYSLEVGKRAAPFSRTPGRIYRLPTAAPTAGEPGMGEPVPSGEQPTAAGEPGATEFPGPESMVEIDMSGGPLTEEQEKTYLLTSRYLGPDGKPLPATGGGASPDAAAAPPVEAAPPDGTAAAPAPAAVDPAAFGVEYKQLPVRMVLEMDQRWLPTLIAQCASQPLQVEVKEVRVNAADALGASMGGPGASFRGSEGMGAGGGGSLFQETAGLQVFPQQPNVVTVVIQGVIYIFNKPNQTVLQTEEPQTASL